jgi:hypothetical protein
MSIPGGAFRPTPKKKSSGGLVRRLLAGAIGGFSEGFSDAYKRKDVLDRADRQNTAIAERQLLTDILNRDQELEAKVASGELTPEQASQMAQASRRFSKIQYPVPNFASLQPSEEKRAEPVRRRIEEAASPEMMPPEESVRSDFRTRGIEGGEIAPVPGPGAGLANYNPQIAGALDIRRRRLEGFDTARKQKIADVGETAHVSALGTGRGTATAKAEDFENELARAGRTGIQAQGIQTAGEIERETKIGPIRARNQASATAMSEEAKNRVYFSPKWMSARIKEAAEKANEELRLTGRKDADKQLRETANAAGAVLPLLKDLADVSAKINTREGTSARISGAVRGLRAAGGGDPDIRRFEQIRSQLIRPLAVAMGVREANISNFDQRLVEKGITISKFSTRQERADALNGLRDLVAIAPLVAASPLQDAQGKADYAAELINARRAAQAAAAKAGATQFIDPATGKVIDVIR